jgi:hypothetical protein
LADKANTTGAPQTCDVLGSGCPATSRQGVGIQIFAGTDPSPFYSSGTWAVTAP